jgi:predicted metal-dependent phosphoesterase TrpH
MNSEFRADLHCHSHFSDGTDSPEQLIELALEKGLSGLSITDHDTVAVYSEGLEIARKKNFLLLNGAEFSASYGGEPVHILAYAYQIKHRAIAALCERHAARRGKRNRRILEKLQALGFDLTEENLENKNIKGSVGRPHIAHALLKKGVVSSIQEAFDRYLGEGKPAYDPGEPLSVEETIEAIHQGKGKAILAHPHLIKKKVTLRAMLNQPFDGIEGYYARFTKDQEKKWIDLAHQKKWIITGGSDYHGSTKPHSILGSSWVGQETFDFLYKHYLSVN